MATKSREKSIHRESEKDTLIRYCLRSENIMFRSDLCSIYLKGPRAMPYLLVVHVLGLGGELCTIEIERGKTFWNLKGEIKRVLDIPRREQHIIGRGGVVNGTATLASAFPDDDDDVEVTIVRTMRCTTCAREVPLSVCSGCLSVGYCGRACQKLDWKTHKRECAHGI